MPRPRVAPATAVLVALVALSTLLRFWGATLVPTPWINPDEPIYGSLAQSLYRDGRFALLGQPVEFFSLVYPALVGPLLALDDLERWYHWTKLLQAAVMSATAVPVFLWARTLATTAWALAAAALTLAVPGLAYSGLLMTEVAFYPAIVLAAYAMARTLVRPTGGGQVLLVAAVAVAAMTRLQAFALVPVFVTALVPYLLLERRLGEARRFAPALGGLALVVAAWAGWRLRNGGPLRRVFGAYEPAGETEYSARSALEFVLYHAGDLVLFAGIAPAAALILLAAAWRGLTPAARSYVAVAASLSLWLVAEVGVFASRHVGYLAERNLLPLAPVLFVGLAGWVAAGAPRRPLPLAAAALAVVALLAALPVARLVSDEAFPNSFTLLPLIELEARRPGLDLDLLVPAMGAAAVGILAVVPRRALWTLPAVLLVAFGAVSAWSTREIGDRATFLEAMSSGPQHRWIDARADRDVAFVYIGEFNWPAAWQSMFWNRSVTRAYGLLTARVPGGLPQESIGPREDGRLVEADGEPARGAYAVAAYPVAFDGEALASAGDGLVLWRLRRPFRLAVWTQRVEGHVRVLAYGCRGGRLMLELVSASAGSVELRRNDAPLRRLDLAARSRWRGSVRADPPRPLGTRLCTFDVLTGPEVQVLRADFVQQPR